MKEIPLTRGKFAIVDDEDYERFGSQRWHCSSAGYARQTGPNRESIFLHRLIVGAGLGQVVDHINRNPLDNRRANLRICTHAQNLQNARRRGSMLKGVGLDKRDGRYYARVSVNGRRKNVGRFATEAEAHEAYLNSARRVYGEFAHAG